MKPSYKFKWHRGDQYAYYSPSDTEWEMKWEMETAMETETETETAMERETAMEHYSWIWSSRKVSK